MIWGYFKKLISTVSLLIDKAGDFIVTDTGDNILLGASPFTDLTGSVSVVTTYTGYVIEPDMVGTVDISQIRGTMSGSVSGKVDESV